jgi:hypothetical protein
MIRTMRMLVTTLLVGGVLSPLAVAQNAPNPASPEAATLTLGEPAPPDRSTDPDAREVDQAATVPEPKRLPGLSTSSQGTKKTAGKAQTKAAGVSPGTPRAAGNAAKPAAKPVVAKPTADAAKVAESISSLRQIEPKPLVERPGPDEGDAYLLRYRFAPGMVIRSEVMHLAKNGTRIDSVQQDATSRTVSDKSWKVIDESDGVVTFEYRIDGIDMSQQINAGQEIRYSSKEPSDEPPLQFVAAAESVGKIVSTISIDSQGMVVARSDTHNPPHMGMGDVTLPLPKNAVTVGANWEIPREMRIQRKDGNHRLVKFRELFTLEKVSAGVATISVRSEPLSTIAEPSEEAQVLQQLSNGTIRFDIDAGRMISKELAWDHQVVAFSGAGSVLEYSARLEDNVVSAEAEAKTARAVGAGVR